MKIVVSEFMDRSALTRFGAEYSVLYDPALVDDRDRLLAELADARGLIVRNRTVVDAPLLAAAPALRVVGRLGVGLDNIDLLACAERGVKVRPATGANTLSVAEYVIGTMLVLLRGAYGLNHAMLRGDWPRETASGAEAAGRCLGLVGFGGEEYVVAAGTIAASLVALPFVAGTAVLAYFDLRVRTEGLDLQLAITDRFAGSS